MNRLATTISAGRITLIVCLLTSVSSCGRTNNQLILMPGQTRDSVTNTLKDFGYCLQAKRFEDSVYVACKTPGHKRYSTWFQTTFRNGKLVFSSRHEAHAKYSIAQTRWSSLIDKRAQVYGPPKPDVKKLFAQFEDNAMPKGAVSWQAFESPDGTFLTGIFLRKKDADSHVVEVMIPKR